MKIKLGLLNTDLANRFQISLTLTSQKFNLWLNAMHKTVAKYAYWPNKDEIVANQTFEQVIRRQKTLYILSNGYCRLCRIM